ncbi:Transposon Ty3-G Gag-Pol poly [Labeo rohita]|uniref:Transposon Ty3-G Gag-Pol poly n=1 Tax=Labeo rohita TaxID=84645 RepID=A0A498MGH2_LABRO|nr:Transposon Ty3-G Gag-Pol poly [Labeo rohita]
MFARHGIPAEVMSDNGPQFSAEYFRKFAKEWGFSHTTSSPRYPQANGEAERTEKTVKDFLSKAADPYLALMEYRATPLTNGYSPAELLMGRKLCTTIPVIPSVLNLGWMNLNRLKEEEKVRREKQGKQFNKRDRAHNLPQLHPGESVWIGDTREKGTVIMSTGTPRSYVVDSPKGILCQNQSYLVPTPVAPPQGISGCTPAPELENTASVSGPDVLCSDNIPGLLDTPKKRYPSRERRPPKYLKDFVHS